MRNFRTFFLALVALTVFLNSPQVFAQDNVGIGTISPDPSALLEIQALDKGLLIPRTDTLSITNPATGLLIYTVTDSLEKRCWSRRSWRAVSSRLTWPNVEVWYRFLRWLGRKQLHLEQRIPCWNQHRSARFECGSASGCRGQRISRASNGRNFEGQYSESGRWIGHCEYDRQYGRLFQWWLLAPIVCGRL